MSICYIMIELTCLKKLILIRQKNQRSVVFVTTSVFYIDVLHFKFMAATGVWFIDDVYKPRQYCNF